jgi:hypothetical protein
MTDFLGLPNGGEFWHWTNVLHFILVGFAGGLAVTAGTLGLLKHEERRGYALLALTLIVVDLVVLWLESPAKWRFSHVFLFLSVNPLSPLWWGAWGLVLAALGCFLALFKRVPERLAYGLAALGGAIALLYPGLALAANPGRPLWPSLLTALFPATALLMVLGVAVIGGSKWARPWFVAAGLASLALILLYPVTLAFGNLSARHALEEARGEAAIPYLLFALALAGILLARQNPRLAALLALVGAVGVRAVIVAIGQTQGIGF